MTAVVTCKGHKLSELRNILEGCSLSAPLLGFCSLIWCYCKDRNLCVLLYTLLVYLSDHCWCLFFVAIGQFPKMFYLTETLKKRANKECVSFAVPCDT